MTRKIVFRWKASENRREELSDAEKPLEFVAVTDPHPVMRSDPPSCEDVKKSLSASIENDLKIMCYSDEQ